MDNGSTDGTQDLLSDLPVRAIHEAVLGPAAQNAGVRVAEGRWIVFLDGDTRPSGRNLLKERRLPF